MEITRETYLKAREFKESKTYEKFFSKIALQYDICIFGSGALGQQICRWLLNNRIKVAYFCDNNEQLHGKQIIEDVICISIEELLRQRESIYVIVGVSNKKWNETINLQLQRFEHIMRNPLGIVCYWQQTFDVGEEEFREGVNYVLSVLNDTYSKKVYEALVNFRLQDEIIDYPSNILDELYYEKQYIVRELICYDKIKTYVDCGAYTGDSLHDFIELGTDAEYYCFEMDQMVYQELNENVQRYKDKKIHLYPYGVGEVGEFVPFVSDKTGGSRIDKTGENLAEIVSLDSIEFKKKIDFIKMDIEGAEEKAIRGANALIKKDHPILAISIYHNFAQFVNVVKMIKEIDSRYSIYIRHHKYMLDDTVCYAIYEQ